MAIPILPTGARQGPCRNGPSAGQPDTRTDALAGHLPGGAYYGGRRPVTRVASGRSESEVAMAYELEGRLLEVCDCKVLCPCWIGEDPDNGTCDGTVAWHIDRGQIDGLDVSGLTLAVLGHIPGNILQGN